MGCVEALRMEGAEPQEWVADRVMRDAPGSDPVMPGEQRDGRGCLHVMRVQGRRSWSGEGDRGR